MNFVGIEQGEELTEGMEFDQRAESLSRATSGVDISNYSLPLKLFTFLYRPLFFDSPGILGLVVSFENVFLLFISLYFIFKGGLLYIVRGNFMVKTTFISFFTVSLALAQVSGNLGLAIRQKSQVMLLFLYVIISLMDAQKLKRYRERMANKKRVLRKRIPYLNNA
ncbi:hypothetical protein LVD17_25475 [Fulvivirga ulvae]|uniref:hypothetical protein n=1 Tax=Fulvivirga ulvae TaxID=2904245 RepID=UPI001F418A32|nr:hypothetical protein [Fulvivirga ulvae]UII31646.1 hypothetical protein LVD17_25475 [Fulvivirga ulvae]